MLNNVIANIEECQRELRALKLCQRKVINCDAVIERKIRNLDRLLESALDALNKEVSNER